MGERTGNSREKNIVLLVVISVFIGIIVIFWRSFYGTEVTDEAFYLSMASQILEGRVPIINMWFMGSGSAVTYAWLIGIYRIFQPQLDGVFLFSRLMFHAIRIGILIYGFFVLKKVEKETLSSMTAIGILIPFYTLIGNFSYNSVPIYLMLLVSFLIMEEIEAGSKYGVRSVLAGMFMAMAVYSHPCQLFNTVLIGMILLFLKRIKNFLEYMFSGLFVGGSVIVWSINKSGGLDRFINGIKLMLGYSSTFNRPTGLIHVRYALLYMKPEITELVFFIIIAFIFARVYLHYGKEKKNYTYLLFITISILIWFVFGLIQNFGNDDFEFYTKMGEIAMLASIAIFAVAPKDKTNWLIFLCLALPSILFCIANGLLTGDGIIIRLYTLIPCLTAFILIESRLIRSFWKTAKKTYIQLILFCFISVLLFRFDYRYVYRDNTIPNLTTKIDGGIYRGLYTTELNAKSLVTLQTIIRDNTRNEEKIIVMDCTPAAYLMTDADSWGPITWDNIRYYDEMDNSEQVKGFFDYMGENPDKIIYVSNPYKPKLSINDPICQFNKFVEGDYQCIETENINDLYEIRIYSAN